MEGASGRSTARLEDVLITRDLWERPSRPPDYASETEALHRFGQLLADDPEMIFQPFRQGEQVISDRSRGVGIGLTIVRELVEACGGTITTQSPGIGHGTSMTVRLMIARDPPADH